MTHLDSLQPLGAFKSCRTVKRTLWAREENIWIRKRVLKTAVQERTYH